MRHRRHVAPAIPEPRRRQAPPAGDLGERRLPRDRRPRSSSSPSSSSRRSTSARRSASSTSRPAAATRPWPPPGAARPSSASTTSRPCSTARAGVPTPRASTVAFLDGDAEALPFEDGAFDVVSSVFGAMFAPDQERTAAELARVTRPGGRIGLVAHTPDGFIGQLFRTVARHVAPPAGVRRPSSGAPRSGWRAVRRATRRRCAPRPAARRVPRPLARGLGRVWRRWYGPTLKAFEAVGEDGEAALETDLLDLIARFNRAGRDDGGAERVPRDGRRRGGPPLQPRPRRSDR